MTCGFTWQDVEDERATAATFRGLSERLGDRPIARAFGEMADRCTDRADRIETLLLREPPGEE